MFIINKETLEIKKGSKSVFCLRCEQKENAKCMEHYAKMINGNCLEIVECPYGYCSISTAISIISGLKVKGYYNSKKVDSAFREKDKSSVFDVDDLLIFASSQKELEEESLSKNIYMQTIHDIKRANSSFSDLLDGAIESEVYKKDQVLRDLLDGLDFIGTRLDYHDFALGSQGNRAIANVKLDLVKIGVKISKMLKYKTEPRNIKIINDHGTFLNMTTKADSKIIFVLFFVLLENAVKYSTNDSVINVTYYDYDLSNTAVEIKNNISYPLTKNDIDHIFCTGFRGTNVSTESGSGIGMSIIKNILDMYGYKYLLPSPNCNEFSFTVIFPKAKHY